MKAQLTKHDQKLWSDMVALCDRFLRREIGLKSAVVGLEGLLDAGEFDDKELRERWCSLWLPLEIRNATGETDWSSDAAREVEALRLFLGETQNSEDSEMS